jgi:hypothetical protein
MNKFYKFNNKMWQLQYTDKLKTLCATKIVIYLTSSCVILAFFDMSGPV